MVVDEPHNVEEHLLRDVCLVKQPERVNSVLVEEHFHILTGSVETICVSRLQTTHDSRSCSDSAYSLGCFRILGFTNVEI